MKEENKFIRRVGKNIREIRESLGISQEQLAIDADVDNSHLGKLERGEGNPTLKLLFRLAQTLDVDIKEILN